MEIKTYPNPTFQIKPTKNTRSILISKVRDIIKKVKINGDYALKFYAKKFDRCSSWKDIQVLEEDIESSIKLVSKSFKRALEQAYKNIEFFNINQIYHKFIRLKSISGVLCWHKTFPIEKVGLYIPGGSAPLFSTVLMLGIPARIAQCKNIILCTPPNYRGNIHNNILYASRRVGIRKIYKTGGAQAVSAMAYGTESIPSVNKIFGPGNIYVTIAKQILSQECLVSIDMPAGPTEVGIIADEISSIKSVADDMSSQAEHGVDSKIVLISPKKYWGESVKKELNRKIYNLPKRFLVKESFKKSCVILVPSLEEGIDIANQYSLEHLILNFLESDRYSEKIRNAGSIFLGAYSPESVGDYASGPNHVLPTTGYSKTFGGLSMDSFLKKISFQKLSKAGLEKISETVKTMSVSEILNAHAFSVQSRIRNKNND